MKKIRITKKSINQIHKFTGIAVCVFLIHLSITGIFLNHTEDLSLDEKYTASPIILALYNISIPNKAESFSVDNNFISRFGDQVFIENQPVVKSEEPIIGSVFSQQILFIAFQNEMVLLTQEGELIERVTSAAGIPENIEKLGASEDIIYLKANNQIWESSDQAQTWALTDSDFNDWSREASCLMKKLNKSSPIFQEKAFHWSNFF